ncbi:MAG: hypothetical protein K0R76_642 [Alphaproteobacteria bacterium]|jgi:predicted Zn finger-like uncharacterized protein|nr:hypothetical protein [Alphaproteobacteria bacterium]MDF3033688.1 hypothetical protein [Alphaproteobacteria bacterium]
MIVTCPSCHKKYLIENNQMPEKGRQVRCGECGNTWWQETLDVMVLDPRKEGITEKDRIPHNISPGLNKLEKTMDDEDKPRGLKAFIHNYYLDWLVIVFALVIVLFVTYRERGTIFDQAPSFKRVINPRIGGNPGAPGPGLSVQGINYDAIHHNNTPHLMVTGEIVNVSAKSMPVPPLTITVCGKNNGQEMQPKSHTWYHSNKTEQLLPGGRISFQSLTTHPGWSTIEKIDVHECNEAPLTG